MGTYFALLMAVVRGLLASRQDLVLENLALKHAARAGARHRPPPPGSTTGQRRPCTTTRCGGFVVDAPDRLRLTDITEHPTREGKVYCAAVLDVYSRRMVGWSIADHLRAIPVGIQSDARDELRPECVVSAFDARGRSSSNPARRWRKPASRLAIGADGNKSVSSGDGGHLRGEAKDPAVLAAEDLIVTGMGRRDRRSQGEVSA